MVWRTYSNHTLSHDVHIMVASQTIWDGRNLTWTMVVSGPGVQGAMPTLARDFLNHETHE